jgi:hypothetical protein
MQPRREDIHLVSPWAPSGVAWLLNALLELGVPIFRDLTRTTWLPDGDGHRLSPHEDDLRRHLPSLSRLDRFRFRTDCRVRWSHEWPAAGNRHAPIILCVRDGADALLSLHRRFHTDRAFGEFLRGASEAKFAPAGFDPQLPPADEWALFVLLWHRVMAGRVLVVRFEDLKRDPVKALRPVAERVGLAPTDAELAEAAELSSFERAKAAEQRFIAERPSMDVFRANHSGKLGESRSVMSHEDWSCLRGLPELAQQTFNYASPAAESERATTAALDQAAAAWCSREPSPDPASFAARILAASDQLVSQGVTRAEIDRCLAACLWSDQLARGADDHARSAIWAELRSLLRLIGPGSAAQAAFRRAGEQLRSQLVGAAAAVS